MRENEKEHLTTNFILSALLQDLEKCVQQIKTGRCLDKSPLGPAGRGKLLIKVDKKKNIF